ncbi:unnamed protein product [Leptidea sinapis]|uniref:PWWP domain-containing protein n=1 Tax=Leptidea sinapis TaxID=189913 RepID=A0A5E4QF53_9NEOP|nr:unnamed protein product [Leptidea sinapis]
MEIEAHDEEDLIHSEYSAGSLVLARLPGWPWWPAMTHYNVVFFDSNEVTRAWLAPNELRPLGNDKMQKKMLKNKAFQHRLEVAAYQAEDAQKLCLPKRLEKYSFIARYKGPIKYPKTPKNILRRHQDRLKRKFNITFSDESNSDENSEVTEKVAVKNKKPSLKKDSLTLASKNKVSKDNNNINSSVKEHCMDGVECNELNTNTKMNSSLIVQFDLDEGFQENNKVPEKITLPEESNHPARGNAADGDESDGFEF